MVKQQKFGLGRGLDALIPGASDVLPSHQMVVRNAPDSFPMISLESIIPNPRQPRRVFREDDPQFLELCSSIREHGLIQPIVVTPLASVRGDQSQRAADVWLGDDPIPGPSALVSGVAKYQIIAGERRWRASKLAGLTEVPVLIKDVTPQEMLELALIENIQRSDLNPIEEAFAYQQLIQEFHLLQEDVARRVAKDRTTISNSLRLLQLPAEIRDMLMKQLDGFTEGHARTLLGIEKEEDQMQAMHQIITQHLTVRQAEELVARLKASEDLETAVKSLQVPANRSPELEVMENQFGDALKLKVDLKCNAKGKGTLVLHFNTQDELEHLYTRLTQHFAAE